MLRIALDASNLKGEWFHVGYSSDAEQNLVSWDLAFDVIIDGIQEFRAILDVGAHHCGI